MSLRVWLPLNGDLHNQGLDNINVINSDATVNTSGKIGSCYEFNASSYLKESTYDWTNFNTSTFSLCCWYKEPSPVASGNSQIICVGTSSGWNNIRFGLLRRTSNGYPMFSVSNGSSYIGYNFTANTFSLDTWNHIAITYDNGHIIMYLNGQFHKEMTTTIVPALNSSQHLGIGGASNGAEKLTGFLNDVRIYDHALSALEVKEIARGLVLHYPLNNNGLGGKNLALNTRTLTPASAKTNLNMSTRGAAVRQLRSDGFYESKCTASWQGLSFWENQLNLAIGTKITYSFYIYGNGSSRNFSFYPMMYNSAGTRDTSTGLPISLDGGVFTTVNAKSFTSTTTTIPERHYATFEWNQAVADIITNGGSIELSIQVHGTWNSGDWACLFAPKIEIGESPTYWSPNPTELGLDTNIEYDISGYCNNGTIIGDLEVSTDTPKYNVSTVFDGNSTCIKIPYNEINPDRVFTVNLWFKKDTLGTKNYETLFGGPSGFEMDTRAGSSTSLSLYMASVRGGSVFSPLDFNQWYMITMVRDGTNEMYYVNAELKKTIEAKLMPSGQYYIGSWNGTTSQNYYGNISDFRIYATALSAQDILSLYHNSAFVDEQGNVYGAIH